MNDDFHGQISYQNAYYPSGTSFRKTISKLDFLPFILTYQRVREKIRDQFVYQFWLISLFILVSIKRSTERLYIYRSMNENISTSNFKKDLYFAALHSKMSQLFD